MDIQPGAKIVTNFYENGICTKEEAERAYKDYNDFAEWDNYAINSALYEGRIPIPGPSKPPSK